MSQCRNNLLRNQFQATGGANAAFCQTGFFAGRLHCRNGLGGMAVGGDLTVGFNHFAAYRAVGAADGAAAGAVRGNIGFLFQGVTQGGNRLRLDKNLAANAALLTGSFPLTDAGGSFGRYLNFRMTGGGNHFRLCQQFTAYAALHTGSPAILGAGCFLGGQW